MTLHSSEGSPLWTSVDGGADAACQIPQELPGCCREELGPLADSFLTRIPPPVLQASDPEPLSHFGSSIPSQIHFFCFFFFLQQLWFDSILISPHLPPILVASNRNSPDTGSIELTINWSPG